MVLTKPKRSIFEKLLDRQARLYKLKQKPIDLEEHAALKERYRNIDLYKRLATKKYIAFKKDARKFISQTEDILLQFSQKKDLKDAEFVFLDRDALPYMYIAREICGKRGFRKEQFKKAMLTNKAEEQMSGELKTFGIDSNNLISIESNGSSIIKIARNLPNTVEIKNLKRIISESTDLTKPIVVIDSGVRGNAVKKYQILLKAINPEIKTYSAMFYTSEFAKEFTDFFLEKQNHSNVEDVEEIPKFSGKLLKTENAGKNVKLRRQRLDRPDPNFKGGFEDPVNASLFAEALRRELVKYKKEKGIK